MLKKLHILIILFAFLCKNASSQRRAYDSIVDLVKKSPADTSKLKLLHTLANNSASNEEGMNYATEALALSEKLRDSKIKVIAKAGEDGIIGSMQHIANIYYNEGNYPKALEYYLKEMTILELSDNDIRIYRVYNGLGNVNVAMGQKEKGLDYYLKGLELVKAMGEKYKDHTIVFYNNIGEVYFALKNYDRSIENYLKVLKINEEFGNTDAYSIGVAYDNIGNVFLAKKDQLKAIEYFEKAKTYFVKLNMTQLIADEHNNMGKAFLEMGQFPKAIDNYKKALEIIQQILANEVKLKSYGGLALSYFKSGDFKNAYEFDVKYADLKDSVLNEKSSRQMAEMNTKYESAKKDKELLEKDAEIGKQQSDARYQSVLRNGFIAGFIFVLLLALFILRGYNQKKKANKAIHEQKKIVEEKQKEIIDSIRYAKRIQTALITSEKYIQKELTRYEA